MRTKTQPKANDTSKVELSLVFGIDESDDHFSDQLSMTKTKSPDLFYANKKKINRALFRYIVENYTLDDIFKNMSDTRRHNVMYEITNAVDFNNVKITKASKAKIKSTFSDYIQKYKDRNFEVDAVHLATDVGLSIFHRTFHHDGYNDEVCFWHSSPNKPVRAVEDSISRFISINAKHAWWGVACYANNKFVDSAVFLGEAPVNQKMFVKRAMDAINCMNINWGKNYVSTIEFDDNVSNYIKSNMQKSLTHRDALDMARGFDVM